MRGLRAVVEVATREHPVEPTFTGSFGRMRAEDATALAMIISELVQNAVEHGLADRDGNGRGGLDAADPRGRRGAADRRHHRRRGRACPPASGPSLAGLGTRIVTSLAADLKGRIRWENNEPTRNPGASSSARLRPLR